MGISSALGSSALLPAGLGFRNKIINGDMRIAQRGTAAISGTTSGYPVDRWIAQNSTTGSVLSFQQSTVAPAGFVNSIAVTVSTAGSTNYTKIIQPIEGSNVGDLSWGTAGGKPITVSFWVRSSVVGTYTCSITNSAINRTYIAPFTINVANTWEYETLYIPADTTGTWLNTNGIGLTLEVNLGTSLGALAGTPYVWSSSAAFSVTGAVNFATNSGATFYLTGVQLEQNYQPTTFEQRPIGVELALCQRYFAKSFNQDVAPINASQTGDDGGNHLQTWAPTVGNSYCSFIRLPVTMRRKPDVVVYNAEGTTPNTWSIYSSTAALNSVYAVTVGSKNQNGFLIYASGVTTVTVSNGAWTASAEL